MPSEDFPHWLQLGLGRAILFLQQHDPVPYRTVILNGCLHNLAYDPQFEDNRARFMFDVMVTTGEIGFYATEVLEALATTEDENSQWQLFDIAGLLALNGHDEARRVMYDTFTRDVAQANFTGADALIEMDGMVGLLFVVHQIAQHTLSEEDQWCEESYYSTLEETLGHQEARAASMETARNSPEFAAYLARVRQVRDERQLKRRTQARPPAPDYQTIRDLIAAGGRTIYPVKMARWGMELDESTLLHLAEDLLRETDTERIIRYIWLFQRVFFPLAPDRLIALALDAKQTLATAARRALARINAPEVRKLALDILADSARPWEAIDMLTGNFQAGDYGRIEALTIRHFTPDERHALGFSVFRLFEEHPAPEAENLLIWLYEHDPCSFCRGTTVEHLLSLGPLTGWMVAECRYDADKRTRELVRGKNRAASG